MSAGAAALLALAICSYLAVGLAWSFTVWIVRTLLDERVGWAGFFAQLIAWPWAVWISFRGEP